MRSGSALKRWCAYPAVLDLIPPRTAAEKTRQANKEASAAKGTAGHLAIETWAKGGTPVPVSEDLEIQGMLDLLASQWAPPPGFEPEIAWGLSPNGNYVEVDEPEPHKYVARDGSPLLTAGRSDGCWVTAGVLYTIDWKFGKWPVDPASRNLQVNAAGQALSLFAFARSYIPIVYYARDGVFDRGDEVAVGSARWRELFEEIKQAALLDSEPHPGAHCEKCWSKSKCPKAP